MSFSFVIRISLIHGIFIVDDLRAACGHWLEYEQSFAMRALLAALLQFLQSFYERTDYEFPLAAANPLPSPRKRPSSSKTGQPSALRSGTTIYIRVNDHKRHEQLNR
jgi:hypothetical protein